MLDVRLLLAVSGARRRISAGMQPPEAAARCAHMMDVPVEQVQRLTITAENACANARIALRQQSEAST